MPIVAAEGALSSQGYGQFAQTGAAVYIEEVFSTWLYTGNGYPTSNTQSINNGIDLATKGGLVWFKVRSQAGLNALVDTARGYDKYLYSNSTAAQGTATNALTAFNNNGFSLGADSTLGVVNENNQTYASWTFRKQPKFFDVVTWTGNGAASRNISHNLGSVPGCIIVKCTNDAFGWIVYHRSTGNTQYLVLNVDNAAASGSFWNNTTPTSTNFTVNNSNPVNGAGYTYVAYLFAHDAGGFGLTGTDNVISCGSYTGTGAAGNTITLGYEPQWVLIKRSDSGGNWHMADTMRGMPVGAQNEVLYADSSLAAVNITGISPTATGFTINSTASAYNGSGATYIYIAIRRGPMKTPTSGTSVFDIDLNGNSTAPTFTSAFPVDFNFIKDRTGVDDWYAVSRLTGTKWLYFNRTDSEQTDNNIRFDYQNGAWSATYLTAYTGWNFRRAPGFFDVVCYTGNGSVLTPTHNLGVVPELIIVKSRSAADNWPVYSATLGPTQKVWINVTNATSAAAQWNNTAPTATQFTVGTESSVNSSAVTYVAYLFATCPGVSKVGSYTGTGAPQTINCGFTGGARFVLIKRTDSTGDWYTWDTTRGMVSGNDNYLLLNTKQAQINQNDVFTTAGGFYINSTAVALNANGGTYIFLAIA